MEGILEQEVDVKVEKSFRQKLLTQVEALTSVWRTFLAHELRGSFVLKGRCKIRIEQN